MNVFEDRMRYDYPLNAESLVLDVGAHKGNFAYEIYRRCPCRIRCYEPIRQFFDETLQKVAQLPKVSVLQYGLGGTSRTEKFRIKGDMTGIWADGDGPVEEVTIWSISDEMRAIGAPHVDLLKINIEGGEYELLEAILDHKLATYFRDIQVQFHGITPLDPVARRDKIRERLNATHVCDYNKDFIWEGWSLR
jgi:FkbM family methyltransferase